MTDWQDIIEFPPAGDDVLNPGGGPIHIGDVDALLAEHEAAGTTPMVDLGGGMIVPLAELLEVHDER